MGPLQDALDKNMNMRILDSVKLFSKLNKPDKEKICDSFTISTFRKGEKIMREGERGDLFYIVKEGTAKVSVSEQEVGELQAGSYFGEMALLDDEVRKATVTATSDVDCFVLTRSVFSTILDKVGCFHSFNTVQYHTRSHENHLNGE